MKKTVFMLVFMLIVIPAFAKEPLKLVYFDNYPPFSWKENNQMKGILIDVLNEAIQSRMGIPVSHKGYPWERAQQMVQNNVADAFATVPTPKRRSYTEISKEPVVHVTVSIFTKKGSPIADKLKGVKSVSDLHSFNLSHVNYIGSGWAKSNLEGMNVNWVPTLDQTLDKLITGRFDVFIDASQVVRYNIKRLNYQDQIIELPNIIDSTSFNLCIGKQSTYVKILPKFDATIRKMQKDGSLQKIYSKYK